MRTTPLILLMLLANFLQKKKSKSLIKKTEIKRAFKKKNRPKYRYRTSNKRIKITKNYIKLGFKKFKK